MPDATNTSHIRRHVVNQKRSEFLVVLVLSASLVGCGFSLPQKGETAGARKTSSQVANAMFQERCKTAGERINRTVEKVEAIFVMKVRPRDIKVNAQFELDDPYGHDVGGDGYITNFLLGRSEKGGLTDRNAVKTVKNGYRYVDVIDPKDGIRYRYTGSIKVVGRMDANAPNVKIDLSRDPNFDLNIYRYGLDRIPAPGPAPRYGVTYDDISTREDREYWIAGGSLKVIDLKTNEVIAERTGYMMDPGQGITAGGRSPWLLAASRACPDFPATPGGQPFKGYQTRNFVEKVLQIKQEK